MQDYVVPIIAVSVFIVIGCLMFTFLCCLARKFQNMAIARARSKAASL